MRRIVTFVLTVTFSLGLADWGIAGPFGLSMGMKPADFTGLKKETEPGLYTTTEVPKPHSAFEKYLLLFGPRTGLCRITAIGKDVATSAYGTELRSAFDNLEERLKAQYGKNKRYDFLQNGSLWKEPQYFMMGFLKKERNLATFWDAKEGSVLKDNLQEIALLAGALSREKGYILVRYQFENFQECQKELNATEDDAL